ncbi:unnamed protein product [Rotaria socialis]|uniref:Uncharacterized protein n=1 Tax=Rotaria socialis TaxID=392032 RepID=A0A819W948_9BILA|nr:unnamed protein product [Rotaria socialis]CAF3334761.1 unnamed protein product [Rotaria socialis]CAF3346379.1 unnamed protein product [Rotaria socialis]CAF3378573.1 unnamed protein product [Rotaria socialis]CAF4118120.1 unnamed protein product [Rotaria socialis]
MSEQQRQQLKTLIKQCIQRPQDIEICMDKIIKLFTTDEEHQLIINERTSERTSERSMSLFDNGISLITLPKNQRRRRRNTYNEKGLVNNTDTVLYDNRDID